MSNIPPPPPPPPQFGASGPAPQWTGPPLASWGQRLGAALIDSLAPLVVVVILYAISKPLGVIGYIGFFAFMVWNHMQEGNTGQTIGKKQLGIKLLREDNGQVVGPGLAIGRWLLHGLVDSPCVVGYLWPLWDPKHQTFADKILKTVVIVG
jgi:uncharacterized RDD family membrane protein YckC